MQEIPFSRKNRSANDFFMNLVKLELTQFVLGYWMEVIILKYLKLLYDIMSIIIIAQCFWLSFISDKSKDEASLAS